MAGAAIAVGDGLVDGALGERDLFLVVAAVAQVGALSFQQHGQLGPVGVVTFAAFGAANAEVTVVFDPAFVVWVLRLYHVAIEAHVWVTASANRQIRVMTVPAIRYVAAVEPLTREPLRCTEAW